MVTAALLFSMALIAADQPADPPKSNYKLPDGMMWHGYIVAKDAQGKVHDLRMWQAWDPIGCGFELPDKAKDINDANGVIWVAPGDWMWTYDPKKMKETTLRYEVIGFRCSLEKAEYEGEKKH